MYTSYLMIKFEHREDDIDQSCVCISPECFTPLKRTIDSEQAHLKSEHCKKWILKIQKQEDQMKPFKPKEMQGLSFDFIDNPINSYQTLLRLQKSDWEKQLDKQFNAIKKDVNSALTSAYEATRTRIQSKLLGAQEYSEILKLVRLNLTNPYLSQLINTSLGKANTFSVLSNHTLYSKIAIKKQTDYIKEAIRKLPNALFSEKAQQQFGPEEKGQFHSYMFDHEDDNLFSKLQILSSALDGKMGTFKVQGQIVSLECFMCNRTLATKTNFKNHKICKKFVVSQMLIHLYCDHYDECFFAYCHKISKIAVKQVEFSDLMQNSQGFKGLVIVDRESGIQFNQKPSKYFLSVELISLKNQKMARGRYILMRNREAIDAMMAILSFLCCERGQEVVIVTNRQTFGEAIKQLCGEQQITCKKEYNYEPKHEEN